MVQPRDFIPTESALRRAVRRAEDGVALDATEAQTLLHSRGAHLERLLDAASRVRDAGLASAGLPGLVTYSRKVFIPLTHLCRDRCHYCTFVTTPGALAEQGRGAFLSVDQVLEIARRGAELGCKEALFTLGDRPEDRWPVAAEWLAARGYDSTLAYLRSVAIAVLEETGLLPHLNPGVMSWEEIQTAQARLGVNGHDAGDDRHPVVVPARRPALRLTGQGPGGAAAGARGRRPLGRPLHHRPAAGDRGEQRRTGRRDAGDQVVDAPARARAGGHHPELPLQARNSHAGLGRPGRPRVRRIHRRRQAGPRPRRAGAGPTEPHRPHRARAPDPCRGRRLGRGQPADPGPRQPRASLAAPGRPGTAHRRVGLHAARAARRPTGVRQGSRTLARPADQTSRGRADRPRQRAGRRGPRTGRPGVAGTRRELGDVGQGPGGPARRGRHRRPHGRPPQRLRRGLRRLGRAAVRGRRHGPARAGGRR